MGESLWFHLLLIPKRFGSCSVIIANDTAVINPVIVAFDKMISMIPRRSIPNVKVSNPTINPKAVAIPFFFCLHISFSSSFEN